MMWEDTMGFDVSKVRDEARAMDPDAASLNRWIQDAAARMAGVNADRVRRLTGLSDTQGRRGIADVLAPTRPPMGLDSSFLRSAAGIPASGTLLGALRPDGIYGQIKSAFADDSLCKPVTKFGSLAVVESQASAALNASTVGGVADRFRNLRPLEESTRRWQSMCDDALGNTCFKRVSAMQQTPAGQYEGHFIQIKKSLDVQSTNIGTQAVERIVRAHESQMRATLNAFTSPLFDAIRKNPAGFAMWAPQRMGEWIKRVAHPFGGIFEWLHREIERWLRDPYGNFVPFWNVRLYRLAQSAYEGDYEARARFLDVIEADGSPENALMIEALLKPTFEPQRLDRRATWEQMDPAGAKRWLKQRLDDLKLSAWKKEQQRKNGEQPYEEESQVVEAITSDAPELEFLESERREDERALYEHLWGVLPEQQYWFLWYRAQGLTYQEIAARMSIAPGTVKKYAYLLKRNPNFLKVLGL
jgi:hypothetical protein